MSRALEPTLGDVLLGLETVGLDEMRATADLQTRKDRKYLVPAAEVPALVRAHGSGLRVLTIGSHSQFRYRSIYFDTPELSCYFDAAHRRPSRYKVRTRHYLDTQLCMLEVKTRDSRGRTVKQRQACDPAEESGLTADGRAFVSAIGAERVATSDLRPLLTVSYGRATLLVDLAESARVTIDTALLWRESKERGIEAELSLGPMALIETKTVGRPCAFDHMLWRSGHRPATFSKYGTGLAALTPTLAANKWNRVLRRHLNWQRSVPA